jgi:hypothetical protein
VHANGVPHKKVIENKKMDGYSAIFVTLITSNLGNRCTNGFLIVGNTVQIAEETTLRHTKFGLALDLVAAGNSC